MDEALFAQFGAGLLRVVVAHENEIADAALLARPGDAWVFVSQHGGSPIGVQVPQSV